MIVKRGRAGLYLGVKGDELDAASGFDILEHAHTFTNAGLERELLPDLTSEAGFGAFARLDFPAGKFPFSRQFSVSAAATEKIGAVSANHCGGHANMFHVKQCSA